jgi:hypothetical protein
MDLSGSIEKFDLHQIFHLLSVGKKSGTLGVQRGDEISMVYFQQGEIIYAHSSTRPIGLGELLVQHKKITKEQLQEILNLQNELDNKKRIGELLVLESLITRSDLENFVRKQVEEIIYRLLAWENGHFKFFEERFPTQEEITINISTENLILESVRRQKKMEKLKRRLPSLDTVLAFAPSEDNRPRDLSLKAEEWNILTLVDARRSIEEIIALSGLEREEALNKITGLFLAGLVKKTNQTAVEVDSQALEDLVRQFSELLEKYNKNEGI